MLRETPSRDPDRLHVLLGRQHLAQESRDPACRRLEQQRQDGDAADPDGRVVQGAVGQIGHGVDRVQADQDLNMVMLRF